MGKWLKLSEIPKDFLHDPLGSNEYFLECLEK